MGDIIQMLQEDNPMTVRQIFYQLVSRGMIGKTENEYKGTVCRLLAKMRRRGWLPYSWIADNTRWMRKPNSYDSLQDMLERSHEFYRRELWANQDDYVEIWLEKDALSGVLYEVTEQWDVPLMVTRGYPSLSFLHSAAEQIAYQGKPTSIYYFGDHDPSGKDIPRVVEERLNEFVDGEVEIRFEIVAVTEEQIESMNLPTRPTKKSDSRSKTFEGESVEVDAIPAGELRSIARECIVQHVDEYALEQMRTVEAAEKDTLRRVIDGMTDAA